ncbi:MAG: phosphopyruvate hydratase, partial [bacterium]
HEAVAIPVSDALSNIENIIKPVLVGKEWDQNSLDQKLIDLDSTENKGRLGANAILGISLAFAHATATAEGIPLYQYFSDLSSLGQASWKTPVPMMNILNGGRHANWAADIQEFMIMPFGAPSFTEALRWGKEVFASLQSILKEKGLSTAMGDEGGFAPELASNEQALELLVQAIIKAGFKPGEQIALAIDVAASEFHDDIDGTYELKLDKKKLTSGEMITWYEELIAKYPIISIEDGLAEDDWDGWQKLTERLGNKIQLVGDDLFVTNIKRLQEGIEKKVANAVLIKPNQIGTVMETVKAIKMAYGAGYRAILSHRSGETLDTTIADLAVGLSTGEIKSGAPSKPERLAKYDRLVEIEKELEGKAAYPGRDAFKF